MTPKVQPRCRPEIETSNHSSATYLTCTGWNCESKHANNQPHGLAHCAAVAVKGLVFKISRNGQETCTLQHAGRCQPCYPDQPFRAFCAPFMGETARKLRKPRTETSQQPKPTTTKQKRLVQLFAVGSSKTVLDISFSQLYFVDNYFCFDKDCSITVQFAAKNTFFRSAR